MCLKHGLNWHLYYKQSVLSTPQNVTCKNKRHYKEVQGILIYLHLHHIFPCLCFFLLHWHIMTKWKMWFTYIHVCLHKHLTVVYFNCPHKSVCLYKILPRVMIIWAKGTHNTFEFCPFTGTFITEGLTIEFKFRGGLTEHNSLNREMRSFKKESLWDMSGIMKMFYYINLCIGYPWLYGSVRIFILLCFFFHIVELFYLSFLQCIVQPLYCMLMHHRFDVFLVYCLFIWFSTFGWTQIWGVTTCMFPCYIL